MNIADRTRELECKIRLDDPGRVLARLREIGAEDEGLVFERNSVYDDPARNLRRDRRLLRVRTSTPDGTDPAEERGGVLTYKGAPDLGRFKGREELEVVVEDASAVRTVLERLGYERTWYYEKRRHAWRLDGCHVVVDELPEIGMFIEVEGPSEDAISETLRRLNLDEASHLQESYLALFAARRASDDGPLPDMRFE